MVPGNEDRIREIEKWKKITIAVIAVSIFLIIPPQLADKAPLTFYLTLGQSKSEVPEMNTMPAREDVGIKRGIRKKMNGFEYEVLFTNGITNFSRACIVYPSISLSRYHGKELLGFVRWFNLQKKKYNYKAEWYDGAGELLVDNEIVFTPENNEWLTWTWLKVDKKAHRAGTWKFRVYIDGKLAVDEKYQVLN
jgi:hypothetical protein